MHLPEQHSEFAVQSAAAFEGMQHEPEDCPWGIGQTRPWQQDWRELQGELTAWQAGAAPGMIVVEREGNDSLHEPWLSHRRTWSVTWSPSEHAASLQRKMVRLCQYEVTGRLFLNHLYETESGESPCGSAGIGEGGQLEMQLISAVWFAWDGEIAGVGGA